jgi:sigma-B regulation protein RsbU (phosphoserine phosphatase)
MRRQLIILTVVSMVVALGLLVAALTAGLRARDAVSLHTRRLDPLVIQTESVVRDIVGQRSDLRGYLLTDDPSMLAPYDRQVRAVGADLVSLADGSATDAGLSNQVHQVVVAYDRWNRDVAAPSVAAMRAGAVPAARAAEPSSPGGSLFSQAQRRAVALLGYVRGLREASSERALSAVDRMVAAIVSAVLLVLLVLLTGGLLIRRSVIAPARMLAGSLRGLAAGDYDRAVAVSGPPELAELGQGAEAARQRVVEALGQQDPAIRALRAALAPVLVQIAGLSVAGRQVPAEGLLAGDWIDTFALRGGCLGLTVGDVRGHGAAAGVHALLLEQMLASALVSGCPPDVAIRFAADRLLDVDLDFDGTFATVVLAAVDPSTGLVRYVNAGHPAPVVVHGARLDGEPATVALLAPTGPLVGAPFGLAGGWTVGQTWLERGDVLLVYTDGLTEARDGHGMQFGTERLCGELTRTADRSTQQLVTDVFGAVAGHCGDGPAVDDRTAVAIARAR